MLLGAWPCLPKLITSSTAYLDLAFDAGGVASLKEMSHITVSDTELKGALISKHNLKHTHTCKQNLQVHLKTDECIQSMTRGGCLHCLSASCELRGTHILSKYALLKQKTSGSGGFDSVSK